MEKEHFYAVLAICPVILALAAIVRGQALSAVAPLLGTVSMVFLWWNTWSRRKCSDWRARYTKRQATPTSETPPPPA